MTTLSTPNNILGNAFAVYTFIDMDGVERERDRIYWYMGAQTVTTYEAPARKGIQMIVHGVPFSIMYDDEGDLYLDTLTSHSYIHSIELVLADRVIVRLDDYHLGFDGIDSAACDYLKSLDEVSVLVQ